MKFLLVDDTQFNLVVLEKTLRNLGHDVVAFDSPVKALSHVRQMAVDDEPFTAVITDFVMPEMDGTLFVKTMRRYLDAKGKSHPQFILLTAFQDASVDEAAQAVGISTVLLKPVHDKQLIQVVAALESGDLSTGKGLHVVLLAAHADFEEVLRRVLDDEPHTLKILDDMDSTLAYVAEHPDVSHIFCGELLKDGRTIVDLARSPLFLTAKGQKAQDEDSALPKLFLLLGLNITDEQRQLVEKAMKDNVTDTIASPYHADKVQQAIFGRVKKTIEGNTGPAILLVDDISFNTIILERKLGPFATVYKAATGAEALACFQNHPAIRLVVCDINLPDMSGIEVYQQLRTMLSFRADAAVSFVMITAHDENNIRHMAEKLSKDDTNKVYFFKKPCPLVELERIAREALVIDDDPISRLLQKKAN